MLNKETLLCEMPASLTEQGSSNNASVQLCFFKASLSHQLGECAVSLCKESERIHIYIVMAQCSPVLYLWPLSLRVNKRDVWREALDLYINKIAWFILELDHGSFFVWFLA